MDKCDFKAEILKQELDLLVRRIDHFDDLRHRTKQMVTTLWIAAVGTALTRPSEPLLWLALVIPVPFWYFDAQYNAYQEGYVQRWHRIRAFIRDGIFTVPDGQEAKLDDLFSNCAQCAFPIADYWGDKTLDEHDHKKLTSLLRNAFTLKMVLFYGALAVASGVLIVLFPSLNLTALRSR